MKTKTAIFVVLSIFILSSAGTMLYFFNDRRNVIFSGSSSLDFVNSAIRVDPDSVYSYNSTDSASNDIPVFHINITLRPYYFSRLSDGKIIMIKKPLPATITKIRIILTEDYKTHYTYNILVNESIYKTSAFLENNTIQQYRYYKERNNSSLGYQYGDGNLSVELNLLKADVNGQLTPQNSSQNFRIGLFAWLDRPLYQSDDPDFNEEANMIQQWGYYVPYK